MNREQALIDQVWARYICPPLSLRCSDWADSTRVIAKGPERGPWRTSRTPYLREPMDCTDPESPVQKVVMQFATQMGKSEVGYNALLKRIHLAPQDMMMVQPTLQDAKDHSRQRFVPTAKSIAAVWEQLPRTASRDETNTWQTKEIANGTGTLFWAGANSARSLASKPLGFVFCDEIDGYPLDVDGEGDPLTLVGERMSNFPQRKLILCSTPTLRDVSRIEAEYLQSDRRQYHVPCPHCGEFQVLEWGVGKDWGLKWQVDGDGRAVSSSAAYVCRHCAALIQEHHKTQMLADGRWIAENPGAQRGLVAGFRLSKLYSPLGWKSWAMLVDDWQKAMDAKAAGDNTRLKTFVNTSLAETYEEVGDKSDEHELRQRAGDWPLRVALPGMVLCTLGVDTQGDRLEAYQWAWGRGMERQLVDRAIFYGDPAVPETEPGSPWAALTAYRQRVIRRASGLLVPLLCTMIDSHGHHTQAVYSYARAHAAANVMAVGGSSLRNKPVLGKPTDQDINWHGVRLVGGVKLWPIGTDTAKSEIFGRLRVTRVGPGYVHLTRQMPQEVFAQITAERLVTRYVKGRPVMDWVKPNGRRNEALDCAVYALAAAHWLGLDRYTEDDWQRWEQENAQGSLFADDGLIDEASQPAPVSADSPPALPAADPAPEQDQDAAAPAFFQPREQRVAATFSRDW